MPAVKLILLAVLLLVAPEQSSDNFGDRLPHSLRQQEKSSPSEARWETQNLREGVAATLTGPHARLRMDFRGENLRIWNASEAVNLNVLPPASVIWSPDGRSVAINNGNGSGQISHITIVSDQGGLSIIDGVEDRLKAYFIEQTRCSIDPIDVSVAPEGWDDGGSTIWVSFESGSRKRFCDSEPVHFAQYDVARHVIVGHLSFTETMHSFCSQRAFRRRFESECREYDARRQEF